MSSVNGDAGNRVAPSLQPWREASDGSITLLAAQVGDRKSLHFPPLPETSPLAKSSVLVELTGTPVLYSYTIVHFNPKANKAPQTLGQIDFPEGVRVFGRIELPDGRRPVIGEPLRTALQVTADGPIYVFHPLEKVAA